MTRLKKIYPYTPAGETDANVGFSLDPLYDFNGISKDIKSVVEKTGRFAAAGQDKEFSQMIGANSAELLSVAGRVASSGSIVPLLKFRRKFTPPKNSAEGKLDSVLQQVELENTYQAARYDGRMKGTDAAMILFYTDLTAKLWALDYNGLAPKNSITGFSTLAGIKVPKLYWDDFVKLSKTRLWFGLRQDSFDINGGEITFEPVSTRVYAASSDPLYPGKESKPNYQSGEFLGWWDEHYYAVADYEPYYYKLNELLKWSCLMMALKEKHSSALDFLAKEPVARTLDFEAWYKGTANLKNRTNLPFIEKGRFNSTTECFKMISSAGYPLMGYTYFISGGVSLASVKDIRAKISKHSGSSSNKGQAARAARPGKPGAAHLAKGGTAEKIASAGRAAPEKNKARAASDYGALTAKTGNRTVKLEWHKGEAVVLDDCVNALVAGETQVKGEAIFKTMKDLQKVVRIELGKTYLIKTKQLADKWIYLSVNPSGAPAGFPAKAAGTEPDSDIFFAKTIAPQLAETLSADKSAVTILQ